MLRDFISEDSKMATDTALRDTKTWPDLAIGLYDRLTGRGAEISYEFEDFELLIPSSASADATHARGRVPGHLTIPADAGRPLRVEFRGDVVALEIPDLRAALALRGRMRRLERRAWI